MDEVKVKEIIRNIVAKLVEEYAPHMVILFGSYAYGLPHPDSDIDLLIIKDTKKRFLDRWVEVHRILTDMHPSIPLGTLILTQEELENRIAKGDQFITGILDKGKRLYEAH